MDLQELYQRTGIELDQLRYCLNRDLLPGLQLQIAEHKSGTPREFDEGGALAIVAAAMLLQGGVPPRTIRSLMQLVIPLETKVQGVRRSVLSVVAENRSSAEMQFADGVFARLKIPELRYDSNWIHADNVKSVPRHYVPTIQILVDLQQVASLALPPQPNQAGVDPAVTPGSDRRLRNLMFD